MEEQQVTTTNLGQMAANPCSPRLLSLVALVALAAPLAAGVQQFSSTPEYTETNPGAAAVLRCRVAGGPRGVGGLG